MLQTFSDTEFYFHIDGDNMNENPSDSCRSKVLLISSLNYVKRREDVSNKGIFYRHFLGKLYFSKLDEFRFLSICF